MPEHRLECPECGSEMRLMGSMWGVRYHCVRKGCGGSHGSHPDGSPLGAPADAATRKARADAHADFDRIWRHGRMSRGQAYAWLSRQMGVDEAVHIGGLDAEACRSVSRSVRDAFPELFPFDP